MSHAKPLTPWQRAAALATEGACLLPYIFSVLSGMIGLTRPPRLIPIIPIAWQPLLMTAVTTVLYGIVRAPLRLWRTAYYVRLCADDGTLPSLRPVGRWASAILWRWQLGRRRTLTLAITCAPSALAIGYGSVISRDAQKSAVQPILWLAAGGVALILGVLAAAILQSRYALASLFLLRDCPAGATMALSARAMRGHIGDYINFIGAELPRLCLCLLIVPIVWVIPAFQRRRFALLLSWMPPDG